MRRSMSNVWQLTCDISGFLGVVIVRMLAVVLVSSHVVVWAVESRGTRTVVIERHDMGARSSIEGGAP